MKERGEKLRVFRMNYKRRGREWREIILVKKCEIIQFILNLIKYVCRFYIFTTHPITVHSFTPEYKLFICCLN